MKTRLLLVILLGLAFTSAIFAQTSTCSITGIVADQSGAIVPGVDVVVTNIDTGINYAGETNGSGVYNVGSLPPGSYKLTASKADLQTVTITEFRLDPGDVKNQNITMAVSGGKQLVTVTAQAIVLNTATSETGGTVTQETITNIDVNGRNFQALASLVPGMNNTSAGKQLSSLGLNNSFVISSNGLATNKSVNMLDGSFNMNVGCECAAPANPELDNISEVKYLTNNYSAKYGYTGGAQILLETKSGGKDFHGEAMEFVRNNDFDSRNFFVPSVSPLHQNIFGYQIGGPVYIPRKYNTNKERTFFYWAQNWREVRQGVALLGATPTAAMRSGNFTAEAARIGKPIIDPQTGTGFTGNQIPTGRFDPNAVALLNQMFPLPNYGNGSFTNYLNDTPNAFKQQQEIARIDHELNPRVRLMARYVEEDVYNHQPYFSSSVFTSSESLYETFDKNAYLRITWTPDSNTVNNLAYSYSNTTVNIIPYGNVDLTSAYTYVAAIPGQDPNHRVPDSYFSGGWTTAGVGSADSNYDAPDVANTWTDDYSRVVGRHTLSAGIFFNAARFSQLYPGIPQGDFTYTGTYTNDPMSDFFLGLATTYGQSSQTRRGDGRYLQVETYIQDDWKVTQHFTLNVGVRWGFLPPWYLQEATTSFLPSAYNPTMAPLMNSATGVLTATPNYSNTNGLVYSAEKGTHTPQGFALTPKDTFMPRVGFAWDVKGNGRTAIRGGIGRTFYRTEDAVWGTIENPPLARQVSYFDVPLADPAEGTPSALSPTSLTAIPPTMHASDIWNWSLSVQRELTPSTVLQVAYAGNGARHLPYGRDWNQPLPEGGYSFNPALNTNTIAENAIRPYLGYAAITTRFSDGTSNYDSLQIGLNHRYSRNLSVEMAYTYSNDLGMGETVSGALQNAYNPSSNYGPVSFNRRHMFNIGYVYDLPWYKGHTGLSAKLLDGWGVSGMTQVDSGVSLTPGLATTTAGLAVRPNTTGQAVFGSGTKNVGEWFNTAAFQAPAYGYFGSAGNGTILGPGLWDFDFTVRKHTHITERVNTEFRAEFYNIFNHPNLSGVTTAFGSGSYGTVTSALDPRILEFGFKIVF